MSNDDMLLLGLAMIGVALVRVLVEEGTFEGMLKRVFLGDPRNHLFGTVLFLGMGGWGVADGNMLRAVVGFSLAGLEVVLAVVASRQRESADE